jgi:2-amino-4-hydroxy-6-hydroxymethyldihydropteridine diphosphokinase
MGSNRPHHHYGRPGDVLRAAIAALDMPVLAQSRIIHSAPLGPSARTYANAAVLVETAMDPDALLDHLKAIEADFGRRRGQRWGSRVLDLDIILWSAGLWSGPGLSIPHPGFRTRGFVLGPLLEIAPDWCDPVSGLSVRHLRHRFKRNETRSC